MYPASNMSSKRKRPVGITLLAISFLWIGGIGTLVFPIMTLSAGAIVWAQLTGILGQSHSWLRFVARFGEYPFFITWFLFYLAYAFIGFGLWKLRKWARKAVLGLFIVSAIGSFAMTVFFVRPAAFASAMIAGETFPFAWITWYLMRRRVRFAFGAETQEEDAPGSEIPEGMSRGGKALTATAIIATLGLFVGFLLFAVEDMFHRSQIYQITLSEAGSSSCVASRIGIPLTPGWFVSGNMEESDSTGSLTSKSLSTGPRGAEP